MIYELRIYSCLPGRLPALLKRFETQTVKIWDKHGIKQAGFWTVLIGDGNNDLYYLLAWQSMADREQIGPPSRLTRPGSPRAATASATGPSSATSKACFCSRRPSRRCA